MYGTRNRSVPEFSSSRIFLTETILGETPVRSSVADRIIHGGDVYIARPRRRRCAAEVPAPRAPIDNRWNKKLEFVYSLVTQIRAAARHPRPTLSNPLPPLVGRTTTIAADVSDQHEPAFLFRPAHHHRRRTYLVTTRGTNTSREIEREIDRLKEGEREKSGATKAPAAVTQAEATYTQSPSLTRRPYTHRSYHFIFPHFSLPLRARRFVPSDA